LETARGVPHAAAPSQNGVEFVESGVLGVGTMFVTMFGGLGRPRMGRSQTTPEAIHQLSNYVPG